MKKHLIYLDDVRTPVSQEWIVVRNYEEFVAKVTELGLENIYLKGVKTNSDARL